jgi:hypothetical protein
MIPWRLYAYGIAGALLAGALLWAGLTVRGWHRDALRLPAEVAARQAAEASVKATAAQMARDDAARRTLAADLEMTLAKYAALRAQPPVRSVVVREVPIHDGQTTCPDARLSPDWGVRFNALALNPGPAQ